MDCDKNFETAINKMQSKIIKKDARQFVCT